MTNRRPGRMGKRPTLRDLRTAPGAPLPLRPDSGPIGPRRPVLHREEGWYTPGLDEGGALFLRQYVLETARRESARPHRVGVSHSLSALTRNLQLMGGWESLAMHIQPN